MKDNEFDRMDELITGYLGNNLTGNERIEVENWIRLNRENEVYFSKLKSIWEDSSGLKAFDEIDTESSLKNVKKRIDLGRGKELKVKPLWMGLRIAALIIISVGIYIVFRQKDSIKKEDTLLTKIESTDVQKKVALPDSTIVYLNRNSQIEYSSDFGMAERKIQFTGEAYFEVRPDKSLPFIIETGLSETRVLGTAFNLKANKGSNSEIIVVTHGLVEFIKKSKIDQKVILEKGDMAVMSDRLIKQKNTDANFMSWKTGIFIFKDEKLPVALDLLSNYYGVQFVLEDDNLKSYTINGKYEGLSLNDLISILEMTIGVKVVKVNNHFILNK